MSDSTLTKARSFTLQDGDDRRLLLNARVTRRHLRLRGRSPEAFEEKVLQARTRLEAGGLLTPELDERSRRDD